MAQEWFKQENTTVSLSMINVRENHTETTLFIYISKNLRTINFTTAKVVVCDWCAVKVMSVVILCESDVLQITSYHLCKVEFNQPFYWLYSVPNLLVFQHLITLYLGGLVVRIVSEIE